MYKISDLTEESNKLSCEMKYFPNSGGGWRWYCYTKKPPAELHTNWISQDVSRKQMRIICTISITEKVFSFSASEVIGIQNIRSYISIKWRILTLKFLLESPESWALLIELAKQTLSKYPSRPPARRSHKIAKTKIRTFHIHQIWNKIPRYKNRNIRLLLVESNFSGNSPSEPRYLLGV